LKTVRFRPLREGDKSEIKALHEHWFPVRYRNCFYDSIVVNKMTSSNKSVEPIPVFTCAALIDECDYVPAGDSMQNDLNNNATKTTTATNLDLLAGPSQQPKSEIWEGSQQSDGITKYPASLMLPSSTKSDKFYNSASDVTLPFSRSPQERIIGCIVGAFTTIDKLDSSLSSLLISSPARYPRIFYIMTLGTVSGYRQFGIGTALVQRVILHAEQDSKCGAVYLHVITYNQAAISFYEKLQFVLVDEIEGMRSWRVDCGLLAFFEALFIRRVPNDCWLWPYAFLPLDYYSIDGENYNCFVYAKYLNGEFPYFVKVLIWDVCYVKFNHLFVRTATLLTHDRE